MRIRTWIIGITLAVTTAALLTVLAMNHPSAAPAVVTLLLGVTAIKVLGDGLAGGRSESYIVGVRQTGDRLAATLQGRRDS